MTDQPGGNPDDERAIDQAAMLSALARAPADEVKAFVEDRLDRLGPIEVLQNRTGLVMLPQVDTAQGATFHLGEVLVAEAHVRLAGSEGYGACLGRDLEQALAIAILDAAVRSRSLLAEIGRFAADQAARLERADADLMRAVEATRVEMETF